MRGVNDTQYKSIETVTLGRAVKKILPSVLIKTIILLNLFWLSAVLLTVFGLNIVAPYPWLEIYLFFGNLEIHRKYRTFQIIGNCFESDIIEIVATQ